MKIFTVSTRTVSVFLLILCYFGYSTVCSLASLAYLMGVEEMTEKADVILVGTVESISHCPADFAVPKMHRQVLVSVERYLKNPLNSTHVTVVVLGATIGITTMWVEDQPEFNVSERVLLFLRDDPWFIEENPYGFYQVIGECQGKFAIEEESAVSEHGLFIHDGDEFQGIKFALGAPSPPLPPILSNLTITPAEIEFGHTVTINFFIENIDSQAFVYTVAMQIGNLTSLIDIELEAYESKTVSRVITHGIIIPFDVIGIIHIQIGGLTGIFEVKTPSLKPAEFELSNLEITPKEVELGMSVTVSVDVTNVGEEMGGCTVELKLDGEVVDCKEIPPFGGIYPDFDRVTATVSFEVRTGVFPTPQGDIERREGTYLVEVEGLTGSFTVKPESSPWDNIPGFPYESILLGLVFGLLAIWFLYRSHDSMAVTMSYTMIQEEKKRVSEKDQRGSEMSLELFVCMVIVVFGIMKGPDGIPGPARPPPLEGSEMILLDKILIGVIFLMVIILLILMYRVIRKDPYFRRMLFWRDIDFWNRFERFQPDENTALLNRRKKREKDQRRE